MTIIQWKDGTRWVLTTSTPKNFKVIYDVKFKSNQRAFRRLQQRYARRITK